MKMLIVAATMALVVSGGDVALAQSAMLRDSTGQIAGRPISDTMMLVVVRPGVIAPALIRPVVDADGRVASFALDLKTAAELGVIPEDNEGLIDHLRAVRGVIAAVFFEELADGKVRVSMRSKSDAVDVSAICQKFGGGGHKLAAGARIRGTFAEVRERVLEEVCDIAKRNT